MDEFLVDINILIFKEWILNQCYKYQISDDKSRVLINNDFIEAYVSFFDNNIIEMQVINKRTQDVEFYLHFQMQNFYHSLKIFDSFESAIYENTSKKDLKVLLSCTSGLTTGMFVELLNEAVKTLNLNYSFTALPFSQVYHKGDDYDVILLAPQIAFQRPKLQAVFSNKLIIDIKAIDFARYDTNAIINLLTQSNFKKESNGLNISLERNIEINKKVLSIAIVRNFKNLVINYRIYDKTEQIRETTITLPDLTYQDLISFIDAIFINHQDIEYVSLSLPGMITDGVIISSFDDLNNRNIKEELEKRYNKQIIVENDVNACVSGLYAHNPKYENIGCYFLGKGNIIGGVGSIINGSLIRGKKGIGGEIRYIPKEYYNLDFEMGKSIEGSTYCASIFVTQIISYLGPDAIGVFCDMIPDINQLKNEVAKNIPEQYLPEFIKIDKPLNYMHLGNLIFISDLIKNNKNK